MSNGNIIKLALIGSAAAALLFASGSAWAGPIDGDKSGRAIYDFNGDGKSDIVAEKVSGGNIGLVQIKKVDGTSPFLGSSFPVTLAGGNLISGAGNTKGNENGQASIFARKTADPNTGLGRIINLDAAGNVASGSVFIGIPTDFTLVGIDDMDNNGADDLVYIKTSGANLGLIRVYLFADDGSGVLKSDFPQTFPSAYTPIGLGDVDGDGIADILAEKTSGGNLGLLRAFLYQSTGSGVGTTLSVKASTFPGSRNSIYDVLALAYNNADNRSDMITIQNGTGPNPGLVRVRKFGDGANGFDGTVFPLSINTNSFEVVGVGNYDGLNQADIAGRKIANGNEGLFRVWALLADGSGVDSSDFPGSLSLDYSIGKTGEVLP